MGLVPYQFKKGGDHCMGLYRRFDMQDFSFHYISTAMECLANNYNIFSDSNFLANIRIVLEPCRLKSYFRQSVLPFSDFLNHCFQLSWT